MSDKVTYAQAAQMLGCHVSNVPKLIAKGHLAVHRTTGQARGHLERADVVALADIRARSAAAPKVYTRRPVIDRRPDTDHIWLTPTEAGRILGITAMGVHQHIRRKTVPAVKNAGRWWIRKDHLELVEHARTASRTRQP